MRGYIKYFEEKHDILLIYLNILWLWQEFTNTRAAAAMMASSKTAHSMDTVLTSAASEVFKLLAAYHFAASPLSSVPANMFTANRQACINSPPAALTTETSRTDRSTAEVRIVSCLDCRAFSFSRRPRSDRGRPKLCGKWARRIRRGLREEMNRGFSCRKARLRQRRHTRG